MAAANQDVDNPKVLKSLEDGILTITLNNLAKRNSVDSQMSLFITEAIQNAESDGARIIIITSNPSHGVFSAGHDLNELEQASDLQNDPMFTMFDAIMKCPLPVIAKVNGNAYGGGLILLIVCDMVYATDSSTITMPANKMGVPFDLKYYQIWLSTMSAHVVKELFFTCAAMSAQDAVNAGIYNAICTSPAALDKKVNEVCANILQRVQEGIANTKFQVNTLCSEVVLSEHTVELVKKSINDIFSSDWLKEDVQRLIDKLHHKK